MVAVPFIVAPLLWGIKQKYVGELFQDNTINQIGSYASTGIVNGFEQRDNSTKFQNFKTRTSPSQHRDKDLMRFQASSKLAEPSPNNN